MPSIPTTLALNHAGFAQEQHFSMKQDAEVWRDMVVHVLDHFADRVPDMQAYASNLADSVRKDGAFITHSNWARRRVPVERWMRGDVNPIYSAEEMANKLDEARAKAKP